MLGFLIIPVAASGYAQAPQVSSSSVADERQVQVQAADPLERARLLLNTSRWQDAAPLIKTYLESHPDSAAAHALMGLVLYRQHQPRASMAEYLRESELADLSAFDLRIFALDCAAIPDLPEAEKWLQRSIEKDDTDPATWEALGHVRFASQQYEAAIDALGHTLLLAPRTVSAESLMGLANERLARPDAAEQAYREAIQWQAGSKEKDAVPFIGLGRVLIADNKPEDAIPWLRQAASIPPPSSETHELLGQAYSKTARGEEAARELETAIHLQPDSARLHLMLARIYRSLGDKEKADSELRLYARLNGSGAQ
ncbi:MAG: tetratricopeptide repeat protein [Terracidiphilus sp.]